MKSYIVIVHKDPKSAYGMTFPDAPGCFSASDELDGLFDNAHESLELWTEGMLQEGYPMPEPRDLEALQADPEWAESFATAVLLIAVEAPAVLRKAA